MRERRWETAAQLKFGEVLAVGERLAALGLKPVHPAKDVICYVEEWVVDSPEDLDRLDPWATEDVTLIHVREKWQGDFFLLAGGYHTVYQRHQDVGTYCSISHPWRLRGLLQFHHPTSMLWLGFRHAHAFIRVRLNTRDVVTPGETRADDQRAGWVEERRTAFEEAIATLELPVDVSVEKQAVVLKPVDASIPFFCSWPDAFGPCQFEYNSSDAYEFLVPASKLAATFGTQPADVRTYLTGFSEPALKEFDRFKPGRSMPTDARSIAPSMNYPNCSVRSNHRGVSIPRSANFKRKNCYPTEPMHRRSSESSGTARGFEMEVRLELCAASGT